MTEHRGNYIRAFNGQELTAAAILQSGRAIILITAAEGGQSAGPAIIKLPPAVDFAGRELTIINDAGLRYRVDSHDDEALFGPTTEFRSYAALRLLPMLADEPGAPDGWGALCR